MIRVIPLLLLFVAGVAHAQSSPGFTGASQGNNNPLTAAALNGAFQAKTDLNITATGGTTARTAADRAADVVNVRDFGALCNAQQVNGVWQGNDDGTAFAAALSSATSRKVPLYIPAGTCYFPTSNPLSTISASVTIRGDGMDVSRLVWQLDETGGSLSKIVSGGSGYSVNDILTVQGGTQTTPLQIKVLGVSQSGAITQATAWSANGKANYSVLPTSPASVTGGTGTGATVSVKAGSPAIGTAYQSNANNRISGVTVEGVGVIGQGQQNPTQSSCGAMAISIWSANEVTIRNVGVDYSRCMSIITRQSQAVTITGNRVRWSNRDGINTSSSWTVISNNRLQHIGDDSIAASSQVAETNALPVREGVSITGNFITDGQGIVTLGANTVSITGNTLVRPKLRGIAANLSSGAEGAQPLLGLTITGNTIVDLLQVPGTISTGVPYYIGLSTRAPTAGTGGTAIAGIPGLPVSTGEVISPYPYDLTNSSGTALPLPVGGYVNISGNTAIRTINASPNGAASPIMFSSLGFGQIYSETGWKDFQLELADVGQDVGVQFDTSGSILNNVRVTNNIFSGLLYGVYVLANARLIDTEISDNQFKDITTYGIAGVTPLATGNSIVVERNTFDGDPYFTSSSRVSTGTATDGSPIYNGQWSGSYPMLVFQPPTSMVLRENTIKNFASVWSATPANVFASHNRLLGVPGAGTTSIGNGALSSPPDGFDIVLWDGNPQSDNFGNYMASDATGEPRMVPASLSASSLSAAGTVASITVTDGGQYKTHMPTVKIAPPTGSGQQATAVVSKMTMTGYSVRNGGAGYSVGNVLSLVGGQCTSAPTVQVTSVDGSGSVTGITGTGAGACSQPPMRTANVSGGAGTGATIQTAWNVASVAVTGAGSGYTGAPAVSFTAGTGTATGTAVLATTTNIGLNGTSGSAVVSSGALIDGSGVRQSLGSTYTVPANTSLVRFTQGTTVATATVTLPTAISDGQPIQFVNYAGSITALTFSPSVNGWTNGSTLAANTGLRVRWDATASAWYREQ